MPMMKSNRKLTLAKTPARLRPTRVLRSSNSTTSLQTPPGSLTKSQKPIGSRDDDGSQLRPKYCTISCEFRALAKMVRDEFRNGDLENENAVFGNTLDMKSGSLFERGRFYDEYSARRNERLRRKKGLTTNQGKSSYNLGVTVESAKKTGSSRKTESLRKSVSAAYSMERCETAPRYMLRSMTKKPPLPAPAQKSILNSEKKTVTRSTLRTWN